MNDDVAGTPGPAPTRLHRLRSAPAWIAVILATLTVFGPLSMDLYLPVLPNLADDLSTTTSAAQLTMTTCLLGLAFGQVLAGPLSDRYGRRGPMLVGLLVYTAASLLCALSPTIEFLVAFRLVQGLAGGVGLVIAQAAGRDIYTGSKLTRYYGRIVVLSGLAAIVAPIIGGLLATILAWRGFFVILTLIGVIVTAVVAVGFGETLPASRRVVGGLRTTWRHLRVLARDRLYVGATVSSSLTSASYFAYLAGAPFVLQEIYGLEPTQFAFVFAVNAAGFATFGFLAGRASERWGERRVFAGGLVLIATGGALLVVIWVAALPLVVTVAAFFLVAAGAAAVSPPSTTLALVDYPEYAGTASSILGVARFAAGAIAAPLVGLGGALTMGPLAVIVLGTALGASAVFAWLIGPPRSADRRGDHPPAPRHDDSLRESN
jgi:DHA1 family bicyclomycin/chloramphenicol resistance-like MFS transporter